MRRNVVALAAAALAVSSSLVGCGKDPAPPAHVVPIADCISEDDQRDHGVSVALPGHSTTVDGLIYGSGTAAIVFANQVDWDLCGWQPFPQYFAEHGYLTATFNYSNIGYSDEDVLAFVAEVRRRGATTVFLVGASKGGTAVLSAGAKANPPTDAVVSLSGPAFYGGVSAEDRMDGYPSPVFFAAAQYDGEFAKDAQRMYDECTQPDKKIALQGGANHGTGLLDDHTLKLVEDFLTGHRRT